MTGESTDRDGNTINGGSFGGPVIQATGDVHASFQQGAPAAVPVALAQLPAAARVFTGREKDLRVLAGLLDRGGDAGPVVVSAVAGLAGVGKTTLAVQAGHAAVQNGWFPGGVLFIDLHGYDEIPVGPGHALDALLRALGVPAQHIPPGVEERAALYRSKLARRNPVLVIADNASSEAQVRPLMPGARQHTVLVTSRDTLAALGARLIDVTPLDEPASIELLEEALRAARPEDERITSDPESAARLTEVCGGLPLALQITVALLNADPALPPADLAGQLADESQRLTRLRYDDGSGPTMPSVAAAFTLSYNKLDDTAARVFRLLACNPGPNISTEAAAVLGGLPVGDTRAALGNLARAHLIEPAPGTAGRWRMHDLVALYARDQADKHADEDGQPEALGRLFNHWLNMAIAADYHLRALPGDTVSSAFAGREQALAWFDAERASLIPGIRLAADTGHDLPAMRLPLLLAEYLEWRGMFDDMTAIGEVGLNVARRIGDRHGEAMALINVGNALARVRRFQEAIGACQDAFTILRETGDRNDEGKALGNLSRILREASRIEGAITVGQTAAAILREVGDRRSEGMALTDLGLALREAQLHAEAITACREAVAIYRGTGDRQREAMTLISLGSILEGADRFHEAIIEHQMAVNIFRQVGDRRGLGMALNHLGSTLHVVGKFADAIIALGKAAVIFHEIGDDYSEKIVRKNGRKATDALLTRGHSAGSKLP